MLRKAQSLIGIKIHARDGELGHVDDFYFDDLEWKVRYMIVRTGTWFNEKRVMLSPTSIRDVEWQEQAVYVDLTQAQIKQSPDLDLEKPVTRDQEMELVRHYEWPSYWMGAPAGVNAAGGYGVGMNAMGVYPVTPADHQPQVSDHIIHDITSTDIADPGQLRRSDPAGEVMDANRADAELRRAARAEGLHHELHGVKEITGYHIAATDGEIGHVDDFFIDEEAWQVQYLLVDTKNWLPGRKVLISTNWIKEILWEDSRVYVKATRDQVKHSPEYDPNATLERAYEGRLHEHYGYPPYWA